MRNRTAGFLFVPSTCNVGRKKMTENIDFEKMRGLAPAIVQDAASGEVLMLGFMNAEAYDRTLSGGYVTFYSRTRDQLWTKGETSGNRLRVISARTDCDRDTLLFRVEVEGAGKVCHEGTRSCFTRDIMICQTESSTAAPEAAL
jgi:phosphoribosyl-ATP pyrophosphohydrolase/phosphoribosyl-AMP cyclohydrolase